jgi:hypothetical protein
VTRAALKRREGENEGGDVARQGPASARLAPRPYGMAFADSGASLTIGLADDPAEREADFMAERALSGLAPLRPFRGRSGVRRMCADCQEEEGQVRRRSTGGGDRRGGTAAPPALSKLMAQPGRALDPASRSYFEGRFARSFADVGVHDSPAADEAARSIGARAFTSGSTIAFARGEYSPGTKEGRRLLAHELAHVVQGTPAIRRKPDKPDAPTPLEPKSGKIADVMAVYAKLGKTIIKQYFVVDGNRLTIYNSSGEKRSTYQLSRPGLVDIKGYYLGSPFDDVGWGWLSSTSTGETVVEGLSPEGQSEAKKETVKGQQLQLLDTELYVFDWIKFDDLDRFYQENEKGLTAMAVLNTPLKKLKGAEKEGPVLSFQLPDWFKALKAKVEKQIADDRGANKEDPNLPDRIFFYGSDKVQAQKGGDAWTIEVEKGKREAYLTIAKAAWEAAPDKDAFARETTGHLYNKVKLILDDIRLQKEEQKEITEIDSTGEKKKGSKWGWAVQLKRQIETLLNYQKAQEKEATDFPDKLTLATRPDGGDSSVHLRVWVYDTKDPPPGSTPELKGGTIPGSLGPGDKAEDWAPIVRRAADALRKGAVTTVPGAGGEEGAAGGDPALLPPYDSLIHPVDLNPDLTTATISKNVFRMVVDVDSMHGGSLLHRTTIHMGLSIGYSWKVYPLPDPLKVLKETLRAKGEPPEQLVLETNDYARSNRTSLGEPTRSYDADYDWDQSVSMPGLGEGDFFIAGTAGIRYPSDWNMKRQASLAALPFTIMKAEDMAKASAGSDSDKLAGLKAQLAAEKDEKKKEALTQQIADLEWRENNDVLTIARKDSADTDKLIKTARRLRKFVEDDWNRELKKSGGKDYDPFLVRLKAFDKDHNDNLYGVYLLIRQIFDYRYDDKTAVDEYLKIIEKQKEDLDKLQSRTTRMTDNEKLRKDKPHHRSVAALVKEDDGNLVPLILLIGHHTDSDPEKNENKMMLIDVTFDSPKKGDMTYVGGKRSSEEDAAKSAFEEFGDDNKYGDGEIVYRVPKAGWRGKVPSRTTALEYLGYALAVLSIVLLIAGAILSAGTLAPASAAAIGMIVTGLGIAAGVAGAALAARNIYKRAEKGTFELDAEFALDVVAIIGAAVQVLATAGRFMTMTRTLGAVQRALMVQRLDTLIMIYDVVELGGNIVLVSLKVHEDIAAIDALNLPPDQAEELKQQVAMEAIQQGAMLAYASASKAGEVAGHIKAKIERSRYRSFKERGWVNEHNQPTENAPPILRQHAAEPGRPPGKAAQGEQAGKEAAVFGLGQAKTHDDAHQVTVTEHGRIIRCSDYCTDLRLKYGEVLGSDPSLESHMAELEAAAKAAAKSGNKTEAENAAKAAANFEAQLKEADDLRTHLFGMTDKEIDAAMESLEPGRITGGKKSGYKIDGIRMPKRLRRAIDVLDIMNPAELLELGKGGWKKAMDRMNKVMGKKISDIDELRDAWNAARAEVLGPGKQPTDYSREEVIAMYGKAQSKFWQNVRKNQKAMEFLKAQGFELAGDGGAALAGLGPKGQESTTRGHITDQERRVSLDHIDEKAQGDNWKRALDADNLELMFQNANSWKEIFQVKFKMRAPKP